jgi:two-component system NarL family sensor kinase
VARSVAENLSLISQATSEIRTVSYQLHPPMLDDVGRLPQEQELTLFRVVQECLTNIHRHSGSSTANVRLSRIAGEIRLEVEDSGKGLDITGMRSGGWRRLMVLKE